MFENEHSCKTFYAYKPPNFKMNYVEMIRSNENPRKVTKGRGVSSKTRVGIVFGCEERLRVSNIAQHLVG